MLIEDQNALPPSAVAAVRCEGLSFGGSVLLWCGGGGGGGGGESSLRWLPARRGQCCSAAMGRTRRRKRVTHVPAGDDVVNPNATAEEKPPLSFVIGKPGGKLHQEQRRLVTDFRRAMEPLTATKLHVKKSNRLQDFVNVAGPLGVTQMIMFSASDLGTYMRVVRRRRLSPTLTPVPCCARLCHRG